MSVAQKEAGDFPASDISRALPLVCNQPDEVIYGNVRKAVERGYPIIKACPPHNSVALLVGGGPSLVDDLEDIRERKKAGAHLFALGGAGLWLQERGIVPDGLIILDSRPFNVRFVKGLDKSVNLLLSTQCDPSVFEAGEGHEIVSWHPHLGGKSGVREDRDTVLIGGSTTVGMRALRIAHVLGYREIHLYGYDSSYRGNESHPYPQPENDGDTLREVTVAGNRFVSTAWMIRQADDFRLIAYSLLCEGVSLHVHGFGLLPTIAHEMGRDRKNLNVYYDLAICPTGYDVLTVLAVAEQERIEKGLDGLKVIFVPGPYNGLREIESPDNSDQKKQMLWGIGVGLMRCLPSIKSFVMLGSETELGEDLGEHVFPSDYSAKDRSGHYGITYLINAMRRGDMGYFEAPKWLHDQIAGWIKPNTITITLREASYVTDRNSLIDEWLQAAHILRDRGYEVIFVRDTEAAWGDHFAGFPVCHAASFDLGYRLALYENAAINLFSANGVFTFAMLAKNVKAITFGMERDGMHNMTAPHWALRGVPVGSEYPNVGHRFKTIWEWETASGIVKAVEEFLEVHPQGYRADYDLGSCPASFDFIPWLIAAEMTRRRLHKPAPLRVSFKPGPRDGFRNDALPSRDNHLFLDNVLRPALALVSAVEDDRGEGEHVYSSYTVAPLVRACQEGEKVPLLKAPDSARAAVRIWLDAHKLTKPIIIVLREASHWPDRNSKILNWKRLAGYLKSTRDVVFVRDNEKADEKLSSFVTCPRASRDLQFLIALYEEAGCVLGANAAPGFMALFSHAPCMFFQTPSLPDYPPSQDGWWKINHGIGHGEQFPWSRPDQRIIWSGDDYPSLRQAWDEWLIMEKNDGL